MKWCSDTGATFLFPCHILFLVSSVNVYFFCFRIRNKYTVSSHYTMLWKSAARSFSRSSYSVGWRNLENSGEHWYLHIVVIYVVMHGFCGSHKKTSIHWLEYMADSQNSGWNQQVTFFVSTSHSQCSTSNIVSKIYLFTNWCTSELS